MSTRPDLTWPVRFQCQPFFPAPESAPAHLFRALHHLAQQVKNGHQARFRAHKGALDEAFQPGQGFPPPASDHNAPHQTPVDRIFSAIPCPRRPTHPDRPGADLGKGAYPGFPRRVNSRSSRAEARSAAAETLVGHKGVVQKCGNERAVIRHQQLQCRMGLS